MDIELLKSSIPELTDQSECRLKYVGSRLSEKKLRGFGFAPNVYDTRWSIEWEIMDWDTPLIIELHINSDFELYDILILELVGTDDTERVIKDYSIIRDELPGILDEMVIKDPPKDIYEELYPLTEFYRIEDIANKNWAKEWMPGSEYFTDNSIFLIPHGKRHLIEYHETPYSDPLHKMCYILNFTICAGIWNDKKVFTDEFGSDPFEHPLLIRLMIAVIRHLDKYPCRQCFFELLFPLAVQWDIPRDLLPPLMHHALDYTDFTPDELQSMAFAYDKFDKTQAATECTEQILKIDPDDSFAQNNLKAYKNS